MIWLYAYYYILDDTKYRVFEPDIAHGKSPEEPHLAGVSRSHCLRFLYVNTYLITATENYQNEPKNSSGTSVKEVARPSDMLTIPIFLCIDGNSGCPKPSQIDKLKTT